MYKSFKPQTTEHLHRDEHHDHQHDHNHDHVHDKHLLQANASCQTNNGCCGSACDVKLELSDVPEASDTKAVYRILNMDCPTEEALIRKKLSEFSSITSLEFNLIQRILVVNHENADLVAIEKALNDIDMGPERITDNNQSAPKSFSTSIKWPRLVIAGIAALASEVIELAVGHHWSVFVLAIVAILLSGLGTYKKGWIALKNFNLNMNALMSFAVTGALLIGQWPEAAMVMVLFTLSEVIEAKSIDHARNAIADLVNLTPERATVQQSDGSWLEQEVNTIQVGAIVRVKPGERIPLDGVLIQGQSTVNQAPITGESLPIDKTVGDSVFAGTINESGSFEYKVTALATQSTIARIIHAVEEAQANRAPTQRFVDSFARIYTPVVFFIALGFAVIPPMLLGGEWLEWIYRGLILLVIACPCALVISTPITIVSGLAKATRYGILVKGGTYLEQGRKLKWLALDKTGTITYGKPKQTDFMVLGSLPENEIQQIGVSLAARSDHPVSKAIAIAGQEKQLSLLEVSDFTAILGQGTSGAINGEQWYLGNHRLVEALNFCSPELEQKITTLEQQGKSVVLIIHHSQGVQALFAVADTVKETSIEAIKQLKALHVGTIMLTGDNDYTAQAIGKEVGIDIAKGNLLPEDKLTEVEKLKAHGKVGMVGDGINDAPALAKADIGFAMGAAGTDTAIETADIALMDDDLRKIPEFIGLSKSTHSILIQNIIFALVIKVIFFVLAFMGEATMWMAVFADIGASLMVIANGLRLLKK